MTVPNTRIIKPLISGDNAPGFEELVEKASRVSKVASRWL